MRDKLSTVAIIIAAVAASLGAVAGFAFLVYHWWHGVLVAGAQFGIPMFVGFLIAVVIVWTGSAIGALVLAALGLWASITVLDMWWFWALCLYATTLVFFMTALITAVATAIVAFVFDVLDTMFSKR